MTTYRVQWRQSDQMWTVKSGRRVIETFTTKDPAKRRAADLGGPGDTVIFENKDGSTGRRFDDPVA